MLFQSLIGHLKIRDLRIAWADQDAHLLLGYVPGSMVGLPIDMFQALPLSSRPTDDALPENGPLERRNVVLRTRQGTTVGVDLRIEAMDDDAFLWTCTALAGPGRRRRQAVLGRHDSLTRLPNRLPSDEALQSVLEGWARGGARLGAVCYLDLDRFADLNQRFDTVTGDAALQECARRFRLALPRDAIVARVGGDEFAAVVPAVNLTQCRAMLEQVLAAFSEPWVWQDHPIRLCASLGAALMDGHGPAPEVALRQAQHAAFLAKRAGGDRVHFFDAPQARADQQARRERQRIEEGLARDEFLLHYQPKVDMRRGVVVGVEALIRWQRPGRGLLMPAEFVNLIEDDPLVEQLGDWAINAALQQAQRWLAAGVSICVSVNVGPRHLLRSDFVERLAMHLRRFPQLGRGALELEILETTAITEFTRVARMIEGCRALGVAVVMDDFGTGYSSLTYLRQLPVAGIKLDRSFVRGMLENRQDRAIVQGILTLAHALERSATAEGVESLRHGEALIELGCSLGQGYGIAMPMSPHDVPEWVLAFERAPLWGRVEEG